jgi:SAM-dependent methyltransferase
MTDIAKEEILSEVATYYSEKLERYGQSPLGVDWNGEASQALRFHQLCGVINTSNRFSVNDLGCGYGALFDFLSDKYENLAYAGIDVSDSMIRAAKQRYQETRQARFILASAPDQVADYGIASGIFNVRMSRSDSEWRAYLESTLDVIDKTSRIGFAFNCLTAYSDKDKMKDYLYYADPCFLFDLCKRRYSRDVALLHDYGLYEFTILVRKQL